MPITSRLTPAALLVAAAVLAACFEQDVPTQQIGGTEYGLQLTVPSPVRVPTGAFTTRSVAATPRKLDSLIVTFQNLETLEGNASYRFYAVRRVTGAATPVSARMLRIRSDSVLTAAGKDTVRVDTTLLGTSTFLHGTPNNSVIRAAFAGPQFGDTNTAFLVVTIEADSTAPNYATAAKPLWAQYRALAGPDTLAAHFALTASGNTRFGNFNPVPTSAFVYTPLGRGRSAFWDRDRDGRLLYSAIAENLTQPPVGYYYQPWLRDTRTRRALRFGELRDFSGRSLHDADLTPINAVPQLPSARFGTSDDSLGVKLNTYESVHLVLEPKLGSDTAFALTSVLVGVIGDTLGLRGTGALLVTVTRNGTALGGATVIVTSSQGPYLLGRGNVAPTEGTKGQVFVDRIPAGAVDVRIAPPAGVTAPAVAHTTITPGDTTALTIVVP